MSSRGEPAGEGVEDASSPSATASTFPPATATTAPSPATLKNSTTSVLSHNSQKSVTLTLGNISPANSSQVSEQLEQSQQTHKGKEKEETDGPLDSPGGRGSGSAGGSRVFADDSGRQLSQVSELANSLRFSERLESAGSSQPSLSQPDAAGGGGEGTSTPAQRNGVAGAGVVSRFAASPYRSPGGGGQTAGSPYGAETALTPVLAPVGGEAAPGSPSSASAASPAASSFFTGPSPKASGAGAEEEAALRRLAPEEGGARGGVGSALSSCSPQAAESRRATAERSMSTQCALDFRYTAGGSINPALGYEKKEQEEEQTHRLSVGAAGGAAGGEGTVTSALAGASPAIPLHHPSPSSSAFPSTMQNAETQSSDVEPQADGPDAERQRRVTSQKAARAASRMVSQPSSKNKKAAGPGLSAA
uniref:Uncharacterized protein n=1 Tax=Chromera velia CCMP2878 TaxID=1169474 RepID=A0A0G4F807_9ALVE|eukprot:Cvel_15569.t1-p1 / transcript=Cvel_15569.t1 / gene=Cvel_15569 / organism=Chromera_velia_CCMP2878 / gene_product=hypothetical protein / transcript_product=hypothetical protein / location=Cvel_scaffold1157:42276-48048(+) / protein_length=418 / sequence_SO=supercontig / SO=protein_coding / is_pseudo=false